MFVLGFLGLFQAVLVPGLIFNKLFSIRGGFIYKISSVVTISLVSNFLLVQILSWLNIYLRPVLLGILTIEAAALFYLYRKSFLHSYDDLGYRLINKASEWMSVIKQVFSSNYRPTAQIAKALIVGVSLLLAIISLSWFLKQMTGSVGEVFNEWDAMHSWNTWAQTWAKNQTIKDLTFYPQLIPINLSIPYILMDNLEVSFFSKMIVPILSVLMALLLLEACASDRKFGWFLAIVVLYFMVKKFLGSYVTEPYADVPLAFIGMLVYLTYLRYDQILNNKQSLLLISVFSATGAVTKQPGIYLFAVILILVFFDGKRDKKSILDYVKYWAVGLGVVLVEYLPKLSTALTDFQATGLPDYYSISGNALNASSIFDRVFAAFSSLDVYAGLYIVLIVALFLLSRKYKLLILTIAIPFSFIWAVLASYDVRNLALVFPILAIVTGLVIDSITTFALSILDKWNIGRIPLWVGLGVIALLIVVSGLFLTKERITTAWVEKQKQILAPELNQQLYALDLSGSCQQILTNYPINLLPGLEGHQITSYYESYDFYKETVEDPSVCWLLVPPYADGAIRDDIDQNLALGTYKLLFTEERWIAYELIRIR